VLPFTRHYLLITLLPSFRASGLGAKTDIPEEVASRPDVCDPKLGQLSMATKRLRPVHPGDILRHDFMEPLKLTAYRVAKDLSVSAPTVNEIVRRRKWSRLRWPCDSRDISAPARSFG